MLTMFDDRTNLAQQVMTELKNFLATSLRQTRSRGTYGWRKRQAMASRRWCTIRDRRARRATSSWRRKSLRGSLQLSALGRQLRKFPAQRNTRVTAQWKRLRRRWIRRHEASCRGY